MNFLDTLETILRQDERLVAEDGSIIKSKAYDLGVVGDATILKILLGNSDTKRHFFKDVDGVLVFDSMKFGWTVTSKEFLPDSYTKYKNKIGLIDNSGRSIVQAKDVCLVWPYKDCVLEGGQTKEEQKRDETFYNETLAPDEINRLLYPKVFTAAKKYDKDGVTEIAEIEDSDNLVIKGNNLLVLPSLLERYKGLVKCIYIDPPYFFKSKKEGDVFSYNSSFRLSTWLVFMKNRLEMARNLLGNGGTIWISIGEDGMHYLKVLADEIFGADHFVGTIPRRTRNGKSDVPFNLSQDFDWVLVYTNVDDKNKIIGRTVERKYYLSDDYPGEPWRLADLTKQTTASERQNSYFTLVDPKTGKEYPASEKRTWCITQDTFDYYYQRGEIVFPDDYDFLKISKPYMRKFKKNDDDNGKLSAIISDFQLTDFLKELLSGAKNKAGNAEIDNLFGREEFDYAKPENLIKAILDVATDEGDLVLDFFAGSGTTAAVAHKMRRQYISIEQMDYIESLTVPRLQKVINGEQGGISTAVNWNGGGAFIYCELKQMNAKYIDKAMSSKTDEEITALLEEIIRSGFISQKVNSGDIDIKGKDFMDLSLAEKRGIILELLNKNLLYVNLCDIEDVEFSVTEEEKAFTNSFYGRG